MVVSSVQHRSPFRRSWPFPRATRGLEAEPGLGHATGLASASPSIAQLARAPLPGRAAGPAAEGAHEDRRFGIAQRVGNVLQAQLRLAQQLARHLEACLRQQARAASRPRPARRRRSVRSCNPIASATRCGGGIAAHQQHAHRGARAAGQAGRHAGFGFADGAPHQLRAASRRRRPPARAASRRQSAARCAARRTSAARRRPAGTAPAGAAAHAPATPRWRGNAARPARAAGASPAPSPGRRPGRRRACPGRGSNSPARPRRAAPGARS